MNKINYILLLNSFFYILSSCIPLLGIKYMQYNYNYINYWFNIILTISCCPIYSLLFIKKDVRNRIYKYKKKLIYPVAVGVLSTIESILLYYSFQNIPLSLYIVLRSSTIIFNIPYFYYMFKIKITKLYWTNCIILLSSYILFIYVYGTISIIQSILFLLIGCFISSSYSNMIEYSLKNKDDLPTTLMTTTTTTPMTTTTTTTATSTTTMTPTSDVLLMDNKDDNKDDSTMDVLIEISVKDVLEPIINKKEDKKMVDYQIIFQLTYFASSIIPSIVNIINNMPPINLELFVIYITIGILSQLSIYNRLQILNSSGASNILFCGLELIRRSIIFIFSYVVYMEEINVYIIIGLVLFIISSLLLLIEYCQQIYYKQNYVEIEG